MPSDGPMAFAAAAADGLELGHYFYRHIAHHGVTMAPVASTDPAIAETATGDNEEDAWHPPRAGLHRDSFSGSRHAAFRFPPGRSFHRRRALSIANTSNITLKVTVGPGWGDQLVLDPTTCKKDTRCVLVQELFSLSESPQALLVYKAKETIPVCAFSFCFYDTMRGFQCPICKADVTCPPQLAHPGPTNNLPQGLVPFSDSFPPSRPSSPLERTPLLQAPTRAPN
jgi:hypothetical protein